MKRYVLHPRPPGLAGLSASPGQLHGPAEDGDIELVLQLLREGADVNALDDSGKTALQAAVAGGSRAIASLLLAHGTNPRTIDNDGFTLLHWAVFGNDPALLALSYLPDVGLNPRCSSGRTPLSWATALGESKAQQWLLERGADPNLADDDGWSPLHYAASGEYSNLIDPLIDAGAKLDARSNRGETPIEVAKRLRRQEGSLILKARTRTRSTGRG